MWTALYRSSLDRAHHAVVGADKERAGVVHAAGFDGIDAFGTALGECRWCPTGTAGLVQTVIGCGKGGDIRAGAGCGKRPHRATGKVGADGSYDTVGRRLALGKQ
jgi:hypothetical protein